MRGIELGLALVSLYSDPDSDLWLRLSHKIPSGHASTRETCPALQKFVDVRTIKSVIAVIPHLHAIGGQEAHDTFLPGREEPGFDVALIAGTEEDIPRDGNTLDQEVHGSTE